MSNLSERLREWAGELAGLVEWAEDGRKQRIQQKVSDLLAAAEALEWRLWPREDGIGEYPPDETPVLVYCGNWTNKEVLIGCINRSRGTYGPSGASHWCPLPAPPAERGKG